MIPNDSDNVAYSVGLIEDIRIKEVEFLVSCYCSRVEVE